jgi:protein-S-isoprenylcysteine O-methyltransferase Ste14
MKTRTTVRFVIRELLGTATLGVALFWSGGRLDWWPAWGLVALTFAWTAATLVVTLRAHPALLAERLGPRKGAKPWDTAIMSVLGLLMLARLIVAGLDQRLGWVGDVPALLQGLAFAGVALGYALVVWATRTNAFFSQIARIQTERGQSVVTHGPYRWVRHPAYAGAILTEIAVPLLLDSWWVLPLGVLGALLLALRTLLEDRMLVQELPGYADYARSVRYRLAPGIW